MRFLLILMLLFVGAAHAQQSGSASPSNWTENKAWANCANDLRRLYGDKLAVVSFMGKQPHESNTTLVGLVARDSRRAYQRQQLAVGCIYRQNGSLVTVFFNSKIANWTEPTRATAPAKRTSPLSIHAEEYDGNVTH